MAWKQLASRAAGNTYITASRADVDDRPEQTQCSLCWGGGGPSGSTWSGTEQQKGGLSHAGPHKQFPGSEQQPTVARGSLLQVPDLLSWARRQGWREPEQTPCRCVHPATWGRGQSTEHTCSHPQPQSGATDCGWHSSHPTPPLPLVTAGSWLDPLPPATTMAIVPPLPHCDHQGSLVLSSVGGSECM